MYDHPRLGYATFAVASSRFQDDEDQEDEICLPALYCRRHGRPPHPPFLLNGLTIYHPAAATVGCCSRRTSVPSSLIVPLEAVVSAVPELYIPYHHPSVLLCTIV